MSLSVAIASKFTSISSLPFSPQGLLHPATEDATAALLVQLTRQAAGLATAAAGGVGLSPQSSLLLLSAAGGAAAAGAAGIGGTPARSGQQSPLSGPASRRGSVHDGGRSVGGLTGSDSAASLPRHSPAMSLDGGAGACCSFLPCVFCGLLVLAEWFDRLGQRCVAARQPPAMSPDRGAGALASRLLRFALGLLT